MTAPATTAPTAPSAVAAPSALVTFGALLLRDLRVLRSNLGSFLARTIMQPLLLVFVFGYVFAKIGDQGALPGGGGFSTILVPGLVSFAVVFQGISAVSLPLVQEFGFTREIEDRVMAPIPVAGVAVEKIVSGAVQGVLAALVVFPLVYLIPADTPQLQIHWGHLVPMLTLVSLMAGALGLALGTRFSPPTVPLIFSLILIPMSFLGCVYYPWSSLGPIPWLKWGVLVNPLVYMSEGLRMALTPQVGHLPAPVIYLAATAWVGVLSWLGVKGFENRVVA